MSRTQVRALLLALAAVGALVVLAGVARSLGWPVVHDAALMHYLGWRIAEGDRPWVDLVDVNLPATWLLHGTWHRLFGGSALAWRLLDVLGMAVGGAAAAALLRPRGTAAGALAGVLVALVHLARGALAVGQRDFFVGVLALVAAAAVAGWLADGRRTWLRLGGAGLALGWCVATKPTAVFFLLGLACVIGAFGGRERPRGPALAALLGGALLVGLGVLAWVAQRGVLSEGVAFWTTYMPLYRRVGALDLGSLLLRLRETPAFALLPLGLLHLGVGWREDRARTAVIGVGLVAGALHFVLQTKGYTYHLEPWAFFCIPAGLLAAERAWEGVPWRTVGPLTAAGAVLCLALTSWGVVADDGIDREQLAAADALEQLLRPDERVVVMDLAQGGVQGLFQARHAQALPWVYDCFFFHDLDDPTIVGLREAFAAALEAEPPDVIVLFDAAWPSGTWRRIDTFPAFKRFLRTGYDLDLEAHGFRLYRRRAGEDPG
ncbi:MAG: hypothetical protein H6732_18825 [Alphaproteobacteria bacterium]|nr:hypothetical protein [Alphaproteobacteria bacterium]